MMLTRMGSLNALEQDRGNSFWRRWLGRELPSADTMGRVYSRIILDSIRFLIHHVYTRLKRNKALKKTYGFYVLIIDGHESSSSYLRCCSGCLRRRVHTREGKRIQYYHRNVIAMLSGEDFPILLDEEEQRKGEDEVAAATRLLKRILKNYLRAFEVVVTDGLYLEAPFFKLLLDHGKNVIAVLKDERRDLMEDAKALFQYEKPLVEIEGTTKREMWDIEEFTSWESLNREVRVVRSLETKTVCRQLTGKEEEETSDWMWATTLSQQEASTEAVVNLGHSRWLIENKAINEMVTYWHVDHVYRHHPTAISAFWLTLMLVLNLFRAFVYLNIKPCLRYKHSNLYFAMLCFSGLYDGNLQKIPP
ncbi:MAG: transposase [bacterium]